MHSGFDAVIGLEVHVQLQTESKLFCSCPAKPPKNVSVSEVSSNLFTCPVCSGHPGTLPVLNKRAVEFAVQAGLATNCTVRLKNVFARKNYFYPDLPKGYQISQFEEPICESGRLELQSGKEVGITRIHMEEDAGKNSHHSGYSTVNLNRAGVPLIEIVSEPEMSSPEEAVDYLKTLYSTIMYLGICAGNLEEGNFRCDANVSVKPSGESKLGTRTEIKNVNSFRFVEKAIDYEISRQIELIKSGEEIVQETRGFDSSKGVTLSQRSKEEAHDYRYFPDPDLVQLELEESWVEDLRSRLPELPLDKKKRFQADYGLNDYDSLLLTADYQLGTFFEGVLKELKSKSKAKSAKLLANLLLGEVLRLEKETEKSVSLSSLGSDHLAGIVDLLQEDKISSSNAKKAISILWDKGGKLSEVLKGEGLLQESDTKSLEPLVEKVLSENPDQLEEFRSGKDKVIGFFVGQVMKQSGGKANPKVVGELIRQKAKK